MGKKKHKKQSARQTDWTESGYGRGGFDTGEGMDWSRQGAGFDAGAAWNGMMNGLPPGQQGFLHGLQGMVGSRRTEQFVLGALIGAAAVYVLGDEEMRNKLIKSAMKLYAGVAGGVEEIKEQMADIRAEVESEAQG